MKMKVGSITLLLYVLLQRSCLYHAYLIQCPHISQWHYSTQSFQCFPVIKYLCLYNTVVQKYQETCLTEEEKASPGQKYVLSHSPNRVECSPEYYQPIIFTSLGNSECLYKKSLCNEEGQVVVTNGTTKSDRTCRCDYTRNYKYVTEPNDICSCIPSEEDCSCYLSPCAGENEVMIRDYRCFPKNRKPLPELIKCKEIPISFPPQPTRIHPPTTEPFYKDFSDTSVSIGQATIGIFICAVLFSLLVLIICTNVRPHVTKTGVVYREDLIVTETENNGWSITVIEGESLQLKCEYTSILPVKSIACQHRTLDGKVQSLPSNEDQSSAFTIDIINHENHSGRYECILTNIIGLSNTTYERWFCNIPVLRDLPAFIPELNYVDINVCSLPDDYQTVDVHKGKETTLEISSQEYTRVMWFKYENTLTSIKQTDKYSFYTCSKPSLTVKAADLTYAGKYVCVLVVGKDKVESRGFKLIVIPQVETYNKVEEHRKDSAYVKTSVIDKAMRILNQHGTVVLHGRTGTGKSKLWLELASLCEEKKRYLPYVLDLSKDSLEDFGPSEMLCIIECDEYDSKYTEQLKNLLSNISSRKHVWLILTYKSAHSSQLQTILQDSNVLKEDNVIDLNDSLTQEEKKEILTVNMKANNIGESASKDVKVKIDPRTIDKIIKTEPFLGFPQAVVDFCKDRQLLTLGVEYFTQLPKSKREEILKLAKFRVGVESAQEYQKRAKYCILAYIATDEKHCLDLTKVDIARLKDLHLALYNIPYHRSNIDWESLKVHDIKSLAGEFVIQKGEELQFIHPYVLTTVYLSHEYFFDHLTQRGSLTEIKKIIRSSKYICEEGEIVWKLDSIKFKKLCDRLMILAAIDADRLQKVGRYIYDQFVKLRDWEFLERFLSTLSSVIYTETPPPTKDGEAHKRRSSIPQPLYGEKDVTTKLTSNAELLSFWHTILLMGELINHGNDYTIFDFDIPNIFDYVLVLTCLHKTRDRIKEDPLVQAFVENHQTMINTMKKRVDIYGNTIVHYLALLREDQSCHILEVPCKLSSTENHSIFGQSNKTGLTPLDIAAYLGKLKLFKLLLNKKDQSSIKKNRKRLLELTEEGRRFRYHATKGSSEGKQDPRLRLNFEEGLLRYIQYGTEKDFLDILDLHKITNLKKKSVRKLSDM